MHRIFHGFLINEKARQDFWPQKQKWLRNCVSARIFLNFYSNWSDKWIILSMLELNIFRSTTDGLKQNTTNAMTSNLSNKYLMIKSSFALKQKCSINAVDQCYTHKRIENKILLTAFKGVPPSVSSLESIYAFSQFIQWKLHIFLTFTCIRWSLRNFFFFYFFAKQANETTL